MPLHWPTRSNAEETAIAQRCSMDRYRIQFLEAMFSTVETKQLQSLKVKSLATGNFDCHSDFATSNALIGQALRTAIQGKCGWRSLACESKTSSRGYSRFSC